MASHQSYLLFPKVFDSQDLKKYLDPLLTKVKMSYIKDTDDSISFTLTSEFEGKSINILPMSMSFPPHPCACDHAIVQFLETLIRTNGYPTARVVYHHEDGNFEICDSDDKVKALFKYPLKEYLAEYSDEKIVSIVHADIEYIEYTWIWLSEECTCCLGIKKGCR